MHLNHKLGAWVAACFLVSSLSVAFVVCPVAAGKSQERPAVWPYDPRLQPITIEEIQTTIQSPETEPALYNLAAVRAANSHLAEYAVREYEKRLETQPDDPILQSTLARSIADINFQPYSPTDKKLCEPLRRPEALQRAIGLAESAVKGKGAESSFCWSHLGWVLISSDISTNYKRGLDALEHAIVLDPNNEGAHTTLAWAYLSSTPYRNVPRALQLARRASQLNPKSANAYQMQGLALLELNRLKGAKLSQTKEVDALLARSQSLVPPAPPVTVAKTPFA